MNRTSINSYSHRRFRICVKDDKIFTHNCCGETLSFPLKETIVKFKRCLKLKSRSMNRIKLFCSEGNYNGEMNLWRYDHEYVYISNQFFHIKKVERIIEWLENQKKK